MVTCFFLGHDNLYDVGLYPVILKAVKKVVAQDTEIEFVFDKRTSFYALCLEAILETRQRNPEKLIRITFVTHRDINEMGCRQPFSAFFPAFVFDAIIQTPEITCASRKAPLVWRHEKKALIDHSDFLIYYEYPDLREHYHRLLENAIRRPDLTVLNVTQRETARAMIDSVGRLEPKQQFIFHALKKGKTYQTIGPEFGVSASSIRNSDLKGRRLLQSFARERCKQLSAEREPAPPLTCAVVLPTKMDEEDRRRFGQAVDYLTLCIGVSTFLVEQLNCYSQFVNCLLDMRASRRFSVELVTHYSDAVATTWGSTGEGSPFDSVTNVDSDLKRVKFRYTRALSALLDRSEYVICKSTVDSDPAVFRQIQKHKRLKVFNLGSSQRLVMLQKDK